MPNLIGGLFTTNYAAAAALTCQLFSLLAAQDEAYKNTAEGKAAVANCGYCGVGARAIGFYDSAGNKHYKGTCDNFSSSSSYYHMKKLSMSIPGCDLSLEYYECVQNESNTSVLCDNAYYLNDSGTCTLCPKPSLAWTSKGAVLDVSSGTCGYGTRNVGSIGITSCAILNSEPNGDICPYCDSTGCFNLLSDCAYQS